MAEQQDILVLGGNEHSFQGTDVDPTGAMAFLSAVGDDELLRFLRRLPMIAAHQSDRPITIADLIYEMKLWPYVKSAYKEIEGHPGLAGRIQQLDAVYRLAEKRMERDTGEVRSSERSINFATFLQIYSTEGLP
ncbi:MAG: hypothetical protein AAFQ47_08850 [Pseudomonadota bacterium]